MRTPIASDLLTERLLDLWGRYAFPRRTMLSLSFALPFVWLVCQDGKVFSSAFVAALFVPLTLLFLGCAWLALAFVIGLGIVAASWAEFIGRWMVRRNA